MNIYGLKHVYMAIYGHLYLYIQYIYTQIVHGMTSQCIYSQEADAHYTKLIQLWYNKTQLLCRGLQRQPSYPDTW